jgi:hypothetical protein
MIGKGNTEMDILIMRLRPVLLATTIFAAIFLPVAARAQQDEENIRTGSNIVAASPELVADADSLPAVKPEMSLEKKVEALIQEMAVLRRASRRATIVITADLQLSDKWNRDSVEVSLKGGTLDRPLICHTDQFGQCVFIVDPLEKGDPDFEVYISGRLYVTVEKEFRAAPGSVALVPIYVELVPDERKRRIIPPAPYTPPAPQ